MAGGVIRGHEERGREMEEKPHVDVVARTSPLRDGLVVEIKAVTRGDACAIARLDDQRCSGQYADDGKAIKDNGFDEIHGRCLVEMESCGSYTLASHLVGQLA